jgi:23S rRNA (cytidine1920-2'-O)/16S rRNA (cytidine1409-2'-O)-methyltransferase
VSGSRAEKASRLVARSEAIALEGPPRPFVSRGGEKLDRALDVFGIEVEGARALDLGSSTGGFTHCLLRRGAAHVVAVDVGRGQLDWSLRRDPRVTVLEGTNARSLRIEDIGELADVVTADLSFISIRLVLPAIAGVAAPDADIVLLVKPQFEAGREAAGRGVVRDPNVWWSVIDRVRTAAEDAGLGVLHTCASPLLGPAGNAEFFLHCRNGSGGTLSKTDIAAAIDIAARMVAERGGSRDGGAARETPAGAGR